MANINFDIDSFALSNTRSVHEDTNYVAVAISKNGTLLSNQAKKIGNVNNGKHAVNLTVSIPGEYEYTDTFALSYLVINHGGGSTQNVLTHCSNAMTQFAWNAFNSADAQIVAVGNRELPRCMSEALRGENMKIWWNEMKPAFQHLDTDHCDGPVAIDCLSFTGASIVQIQLGANQQQPFSFIYLGIDSAVGCGSNSDYSVQWNSNVV